MTARIGSHPVNRVGYGAMQLDQNVAEEDAGAILRRAVELGVNHIDTASFYGAGEVNRRIRRTLAPYRDDLVIVSKVGATPADGPIPLKPAQKPAELRAEVEANLTELGLECIPVVNLRRLDLGPGVQAEGDQIVSMDDQLAEMIALRDEGKIGAIGLSAVDVDGVRAALPAGIVCVQNAYSLLDRAQEATLELCRAEGIAWVPFFPLGSAFPGFPNVADNPVVQAVAADLDATAAQVGLAWLLMHAPNTLLIPGTRSLHHLEQNIAAATLALPADATAWLDAVGSTEPQHHGMDQFIES
ncbi:aldo/keto reductase [Mycobacterium sp. MS1601]|uniref:aldo/keto reductase n=1 Tax=Mycobacterium sp. MS1601 TaxID=1936029 RepID=UPI001F264C94|nr:aldo/keto reductase [Mycobacterium sp. MS1601]